MEDRLLIEANQLSKKFSKSLRRSMFYGARELANNLVGRKPKTNVLRPTEFWAVDHVDLEVKRGQVLGIVGHNGCGKSTLLRLIAGIYPPDDGSVRVKGKVAALISLGVGFHPYLTGRENIYLNGTLLGMEKNEIDEKLEEIIAFSELEEFINSPVATYSSGMRVRLGFSIAIATKPDILLLDEILAVGDRMFKAKSYKMISELSEQTASILITHNMPMVSRICSEIIVMERGRFVFKSKNVGEGIEYYQLSQTVSAENVSGKGLIELKEFLLSADSDEYNSWAQLRTSDSLAVRFCVSIADLAPQVVSRILIYDSDFNIVGETFSAEMLFAEAAVSTAESEYDVDVLFPSISLRAGSYTLSLEFIDLQNNQLVKKFHAVGSFQIIDDTIAQESTIQRASFYYDTDWKLDKKN